MLELANIDAYSEYTKFSTNNFNKFLKIICDSSVPRTFGSSPRDLDIKYFKAKNQFLAKVIRNNVLPQSDKNKLFDYNDLQVIYNILTFYVPFGLPYFLVSSMINCANKGFIAYGLLLTKIFRAHNINLSDEMSMVVDKVFSGTFSPPTCSLHYYKMSDSTPKQSSTSKDLNFSALDICVEIEKKMDKFLEEFKVTITRINERLDVLQFQVNCSNGVSVNLPPIISATLSENEI